MARPRKEADGGDARQRIREALWFLLEKHELRDITVSMITEQAGCNRGTFYYHFNGIDDLLRSVISDDVLQRRLVAELTFRISDKDEAAVRRIIAGTQLRRLSIMINHAGIETAFDKVFDSLAATWTSILCPDGTPLKPEAQAIILYYVGGILSMMAATLRRAQEPCEGDDSRTNDALIHFVMENGEFITKQICLAQGVSPDVALERITTIVHFMDSMR